MLWFLLLIIASQLPAAVDRDDLPNPRIAFFPLWGDAKADLRERAGFSLRQKLDRTGLYDVIDGPKMLEVAAEAKDTITAATTADAINELGKIADATILVSGDMQHTTTG